MRRLTTFFLVGITAWLIVPVVAAQAPGDRASSPTYGAARMLNHLGLVVPDVPEAVTYYTEKMGYREAFRTYAADGRLSAVYMQISKETFLELLDGAPRPGEPARRTGFDHYGLWVTDTKAAVPMFRLRGVMVQEPSTSIDRYQLGGPEMPGATVANISDPYKATVELVQPSARQRQAIENWPGPGANTGIRMMNHVSVNVPNAEDAVKYYKEKLGLREGFRSYNAQGQIVLVYLHLSQDTFLEINEAAAFPQWPLGMRHYGLWVDDTNAAVEMLRQRGVKVSNPSLGVHRPTPEGSPMTGAVTAQIEDPYMGHIELIQISPQQQRAIASWSR